MVSVYEAAVSLGVDPRRVRALLAAGQLEGRRVGGRWLVEPASVAHRARAGTAPGRRLTAPNAWGALFLASGEEAPWLSAPERYRIRRLLAGGGLAGLRPRLTARAVVRRLDAGLATHPGLVLTGASAAAGRGLELDAEGRSPDAYVPAALAAEAGPGPLPLRVLPAGLWPFAERLAPVAAVAVDLSDGSSAHVGRRALEELDALAAWRAPRRA